MNVIKRRPILPIAVWGCFVGVMVAGCSVFAGDVPEAVVPESAEAIALTSSAFEIDGTIPPIYTCDGEDGSPELSWIGVPENAQSLALIMDDPDAPRGSFVHWVVYDIPPDVTGFAETRPPEESLAVGGLQGKNGFRNIGYGGPCPPSGTHRYVFKLYALDTILELPPGASNADVVKAMNGHIVGFGTLTGQYARP